MLEIRRIVLREIRLPLREPFTISSGTTSERRILLIEAIDADGTRTWSECVAGEAPNYSYETIDTARLAIRSWLAPLLFGASFDDPGGVHRLFEARVRGHRMAKAALEMAAWGLRAVRREKSLARIVGGTRERIEVGISLGIQADPAALVERARAAREAGYRRIKMKVKPGADLAYLSAVRDVLGPDAPLSADANAAYRLADADRLAALDRLALTMIEQPLAEDDLRQHAALQARLATPICLDESITTVERAEDMIAMGSGRIVNIKPGRVGGFTSARAIHDCCAAHGIPVWCGGMLESGIGRAYNVALAALPNFVMPGDISPSARYWERDIVTPEWTMQPDGTIAVPLDRPGLGVAVDEDRVDDLTVQREECVA